MSRPEWKDRNRDYLKRRDYLRIKKNRCRKSLHEKIDSILEGKTTFKAQSQGIQKQIHLFLITNDEYLSIGIANNKQKQQPETAGALY